MFDWLIPLWAQSGPDLLKLMVAFLLALPVAWEREQSTRLMGLRTFFTSR